MGRRLCAAARTIVVPVAALLAILCAPAHATLPPKQCRAAPAPHSYHLHEVRNPGKVCRSFGARAFGFILGCTIQTRPKPIVIVPKNCPHHRPCFVLRHEWGHVNCPKWKH